MEENSIRNIIYKRIDKLLCITAFSFIILSLYIITKTPSPTGYEISIYDIYPWYFWMSIIIAIYIGHIILMRIVSSPERNNYWTLGYMAILSANAILLFMPIIRGYYTYGRGDPPSHIGLIKDLMNTSTTGLNYYPLDHILSAVISYIAAISVEKNIMIIPVIFNYLYMFSIYILARTIFKDKKKYIPIVVFSTILLLGSGNLVFAPSYQSFFLLPFLLYIFFKGYYERSSSLSFRILFILTISSITYFHPITILFVILSVFIVQLSTVAFRKNSKGMSFGEYLFSGQTGFNAIIISLILFFSWYLSFSSMRGNFRQILSSLFNGSDETNYVTYSNLLEKVAPSLSELIKLMYYKYGLIILMGLFGTIFSIVYIRSFLRNKGRNSDINNLFMFSILYILFTILSIFSFYNNILIDFWRVYKYSIFYGTIIIGMGFYSFINNYSFEKYKVSIATFPKINLKIIFIYIIIFVFIFTSIFSLYPSPINKASNNQISEMEVNGFRWLFDYWNEKSLVQEMGVYQYRFHDMIFGRWNRPKNVRVKNTEVPPHFNYTTNKSIGDYYSDKRYVVIPIHMKTFYSKVFPEYKDEWRVFPEDFVRFENDSNVLKIYDNKGLNIYQIE